MQVSGDLCKDVSRFARKPDTDSLVGHMQHVLQAKELEEKESGAAYTKDLAKGGTTC